MLPYTGFGIPLVAFNAVTNLETSSVGTGAPVLAALPSTTSNKVFNSIKGDGTTTEVTVAPPLTGGDITVACTSNMLDKTTDQTITSTKTFTTPPIITTTGNTHVVLNHTDSVGTACDFEVQQNGQAKMSIGYNPTSTDAYLWAMNAVDLKIGSNGSERLRLKSGGVAVDNTGTVLALAPTPPGMLPTTFCFRNNLLSSTGYAAYYVLNNTLIYNVVDTITPYDTAIATDSGVSNSAGTFTINTSGTYTIVATIGYLVSGAGFRRSYIKLNSSDIQYGQNRIPGSAVYDGFMVSSFTAKLTAGDTIKVMTLQSSGGNLTLIGYNGFAGTSMTMIQITRIS